MSDPRTNPYLRSYVRRVSWGVVYVAAACVITWGVVVAIIWAVMQ